MSEKNDEINEVEVVTSAVGDDGTIVVDECLEVVDDDCSVVSNGARDHLDLVDLVVLLAHAHSSFPGWCRRLNS